MLTNAKLKTLIFSWISNAEFKYFNIKAEQKFFYSLLKISSAIKKNLKDSVF